MAFIDAQNVLSSGQEVTVTAASTNVLDLGVNVGRGNPIYAVAEFKESMVGQAGTTSIKATLEHCDTEDGSFTTLADAAAIVKAAALKGKRLFEMALPLSSKRFVRFNYTVVGDAFTAGKINAWVGDNPQTMPS